MRENNKNLQKCKRRNKIEISKYSGVHTMTIGERIKQKRKQEKVSVEYLAKELGVSCSTIYRYEDSSIEKIPVNVFDKLCTLLNTSPAELMGNANVSEEKRQHVLPTAFDNPREAMEFMLKIPTLAAYGGYNPDEMDDETIVEFANEILQQLKLVSYKYKK